MTLQNSLRGAALVALLSSAVGANGAKEDTYHDSHVHLTNYVQEGLTAREYLQVVGERSTHRALPCAHEPHENDPPPSSRRYRHAGPQHPHSRGRIEESPASARSEATIGEVS